MVSIRHKAWLIDATQHMASLTTDSPQRNATVITPPHSPYSEYVFCILALPRVTLGVTAKEVNKDHLAYQGVEFMPRQ